MALDLVTSVKKIGKICQAVCVASEIYIARGGTNDSFAIQPILDRLAGAKQLNDAGPGLQNLIDAIAANRHQGTIGNFIGVEYESPSSYLNQGSPMYRLRREWWLEIFNLGMKSNPAGGLMHLVDTFEEMTMFLGIMLWQIVLRIRIYNFGSRTNVSGRLTISQLADDVARHFEDSTAAVVFTVPARAVAINNFLGVSALLDMIRSHVMENAFIRSQVQWHGTGADVKARLSPFWEDFARHEQLGCPPCLLNG